YVSKLITDLSFIITHTDGVTKEEFGRDEVLQDSVMFRMIQISENAAKLTDGFREAHPDVPWRAIRGMRNRIVHEYGHVDISVVYDTVMNDIPSLLEAVEKTD
nr:DUF86 domain-containing protein [Clostridia bacterium]